VVGKVATLRLKEGDLPGIDQLEQVKKHCTGIFFKNRFFAVPYILPQ
jgi:hypothetical protein